MKRSLILIAALGLYVFECKASEPLDLAADAEKTAAEALNAADEAEQVEREVAKKYPRSYLCVPEAVVGISTVGPSFEPGVVDARNRKVVLSNSSGTFRARWHGNDHPFLDRCDSEGFSCKFALDGDGGTFSRASDGAFLLTWGEIGADKQQAHYMARGRCSKI